MSKKLISKINGVDIFAEVSEDGGVFIPIKPICAALGIADNKQREKILEDDILASVGTLRVSTGADGKQYEMFCLPLEYIYGWLFTINPKNVAESARETVSRYRRECYEVLYDHFAGRARVAEEQARAEAELLRRKNLLLEGIKASKAEIRELDGKLEKLSADRLNPQPKLF